MKVKAGVLAHRDSVANYLDKRKGVCVHVAEPHEMPVDADGNRADILMDPNATLSRMNLGRLYEQYVNAASRDLARDLRVMYDLDPKAGKITIDPTQINLVKSHRNYEQATARLLRYYEIVSPKMHEWFTTGVYTKPFHFHLAEILRKNMITIYSPADADVDRVECVEELEREFRPVYGPVTYIGNSGRVSKTRDPVRIGSMYIIMLEKTGDDWSAVSSSKLQNFGVIAQITNRDKHSQPIRTNAVRAWGETESRIVAAYMGPLLLAEILDRNNSIMTHEQMLKSILEAERPSCIQSSVDRNINPLGNARPLQLVKHLIFCGGSEFVYTPHQPSAPSGLHDE